MTKETKEITITKEIYRAEDGTEFVSRLRCEDYEWELNQKKRKQAIEPLKVYLNEVNWPSICNPDGPAHEYHWYKVNSENDVKLVCDGLKDYHRDFRDYKNVMPYLKFSPTYILPTISNVLKGSDVCVTNVIPMYSMSV